MNEKEYELFLEKQSILEDKVKELEEYVETLEAVTEQVLEQMAEINKNFIKLSERVHTKGVGEFLHGTTGRAMRSLGITENT